MNIINLKSWSALGKGAVEADKKKYNRKRKHIYHKIRIPFAFIQNAIIRFSSFLTNLTSEKFLDLSSPIEWDIYLTTVEDLKLDLRESKELDYDYLFEILTFPLPKYIWRASGSCEERKIVDLLFDATDIEQGNFFLLAVEYDVNFNYMLHFVSVWPKFKQKYNNKPEWKIIEWYSKT